METARHETMEQKQRQRLERILGRIEEVWNHSDAEAYAALYAPDAVYVSRGGALWEGRAEIQKQHALAFAGPLRYTILHFRAGRVRMLTRRAAVVYAALEIANPWKPEQLVQALTTFVFVATHDDWLIASAHTTDVA